MNARRSRTTELAKKLTEAQMCQVFDLSLSNKMPSIYVHLYGRDTDKTLLKAARIKGMEEIEEIESFVCEVCGRPLKEGFGKFYLAYTLSQI